MMRGATTMQKHLSSDDIWNAQHGFNLAINQGSFNSAEAIYNALKVHWEGFLNSQVDLEDHDLLWDTLILLQERLHPAVCTECLKLQDELKTAEGDIEFWKNCFENAVKDVELLKLRLDRLDHALNVANQGLEHLLNS
jgi:hypothetical protein